MEAVMLIDVGRLEIVDDSEPLLEPGEALYQVLCCALCRTDAKMWQKGHRDLVLPRILGHEAVVRDPGSGKVFVVWPGNACGRCSMCRSERENLCWEMKITGFHRNGALASWIALRPENLVPLPRNLEVETAALAEPMACGLNGLDQLGLAPGSSLLVLGGGPVGILLTIAAFHRHLRPILVEPRGDRSRRARDILRGLSILVVEETKGLRFVDGVINAAASPTTLRDGLQCLRPGGTFCHFSAFPPSEAISTDLFNLVHYRQLRIVGAYGCTRRHMVEALQILTEAASLARQVYDGAITMAQVPVALDRMWRGMGMKYYVSFTS